MAEVLRCDHCHTLSPAEPAIGWMRVERICVEVRKAEEQPGPWHFCTEGHLARFFARRAVAKPAEVP